jgi:hypothetical protein
MTTRSESLAAKVEQSIKDLLAAVEASTPEQWGAKCSDGEWTQGFAAFHAAMNIEPISRTLRGVAEGKPFPPISMDAIDNENAAQAKEHAGCTRAETIELIRGSATPAAEIARSLSDAQLDRKIQPPAPMPEMTVEQIMEMVLVGHTSAHVQTITGAR